MFNLKKTSLDCFENDELFEFNKKPGWSFIFCNLIQNPEGEPTAKRAKIQELINELKGDSTLENAADIYKERIMSAKQSVKIKQKEEPKQKKKIEELKKDLFKLNKTFLEDFKNYQIIKLNIRKSEDDINDIQAHNQAVKRRQGFIRNSFIKCKKILYTKKFKNLSWPKLLKNY